MTRPELTNPAVAPTTNGVQVGTLVMDQDPSISPGTASVKPNISVKLADGKVLTFQGRQAQTLALLIRKGKAGLTSGEASGYGWARRTSAYVRCLRVAGVPIVTGLERALDARIGRYFLAGPVLVLSQGEAKTE
jgi:hypothetical protein